MEPGDWRKTLRAAVERIRAFARSKPVRAVKPLVPGVTRRLGLALGGGFARGLAPYGNYNRIIGSVGTGGVLNMAGALNYGAAIPTYDEFSRELP